MSKIVVPYKTILNTIEQKMKKIITLLLVLIVCGSLFSQAQPLIIIPQVKLPYDSTTKTALLTSLQQFLLDKNGRLHTSTVVDSAHYQRFRDFFDIFQDIEKNKKYNSATFYTCYLTNVVQQPDQSYKVTLAYNGISPEKEVINVLNVSMLARKTTSGQYQFYCTFEENTRHWQARQVGNITFYDKGEFDSITATDFDRYNSWLAQKLKTKPLVFKYYKCQDIQEVYALLGINYDLRRNGEQRSGSFDTNNMVFLSGTNTEQYKHDLTHTYFGLMAPDSIRNWSAEEGFNIYTTDYWGESSEQIFRYLVAYFDKNPTASAFELFEKNPILKYPIPIKYPISAVIMRKIEREYGFEKVLQLILSGEDDRGFWAQLKRVAGIDKHNFDEIFKAELRR